MAKGKRPEKWLWNQELPLFDWDEPDDEFGNLVHATQHGVDDVEIEDAFTYDLAKDSYMGEFKTRLGTEPRYKIISRIPGGSAVVVVYTIRRGLIRPIHSHWAEPYEVKELKTWETK